MVSRSAAATARWRRATDAEVAICRAPATVPAPAGAAAPLAAPGAARCAAFRWYWIAQWPTLLGTWMQVVALGYLVFDLTHSSTAVAAVAAADGLPAVVLSLARGPARRPAPAPAHPARHPVRARGQLRRARGAGADRPRRLLVDHRGRGRLRLGRLPRPAHPPGDGRRPRRPRAHRQRGGAQLDGDERHADHRALAGRAAHRHRRTGRVLRGARRRLHRAAGGAAHGDPRRPPLPRAAGATAVGDLFEGLRTVRRDPLVRGIVIVVRGAGVPRRVVHALPAGAGANPAARWRRPCSACSTRSAASAAWSAGWSSPPSATPGGRRRLLVVGGAVYAVSLFTLAHSSLLPVSLVALVGISFAFLAMNTSMTTLLQTDADPALRGRLLGIYAMTLRRAAAAGHGDVRGGWPGHRPLQRHRHRRASWSAWWPSRWPSRPASAPTSPRAAAEPARGAAD